LFSYISHFESAGVRHGRLTEAQPFVSGVILSVNV